MRALSFLEIPLRAQKPRNRGLTIVRDRMYPLSQQRGFLETYAAFVDYAKISNISACLYPETLLRAKIDLYQAHNVKPMFGGLVFETAFAQGKIDAFVDYVRKKDAAVEISDNIVNITIDERLTTIDRLHTHGVEVLCEVGEKYPKTPFDVTAMSREINRLCAAGISLVVLERGEIDFVLGDDCNAPTKERLSALFDNVGHEKLLAEVETKRHIVYMIKSFGPEINLGPNIDWELVPWLEPLRLGIGRDIGHAMIETLAGSKQVRSQ